MKQHFDLWTINFFFINIGLSFRLIAFIFNNFCRWWIWNSFLNPLNLTNWFGPIWNPVLTYFKNQITNYFQLGRNFCIICHFFDILLFKMSHVQNVTDFLIQLWLMLFIQDIFFKFWSIFKSSFGEFFCRILKSRLANFDWNFAKFCRIFKSNFDYFSALWNWSNSAEFFADFQTQFRSIVSRWNLLNFPRWSETSFSLKVSNSSWISLHFLGINKFCFHSIFRLKRADNKRTTAAEYSVDFSSVFDRLLSNFLTDFLSIFPGLSNLAFLVYHQKFQINFVSLFPTAFNRYLTSILMNMRSD